MKKIIIGMLATLASMGWTVFASAYSITDTVIVGGKEWAQVDLFTGLTWNDLNSVCPGGVCGVGTLNDYDMLGWVWASTDQVNALLNAYIPGSPLGPGPDYLYAAPEFIADNFFADWRVTEITVNPFSGGLVDFTSGWLSDNSTHVGGMSNGAGTVAGTSIDLPVSPEFGDINKIGGWFVRNDVPVPATLPLIGLALAALAWARRKA